MKKVIFFTAFCLSSVTSFAADNFDSNTGILDIPDLNIDAKPFGSASLKLDLKNGTFKILSTKPNETPKQEPFTYNGYSFTELGCKKSGTTEVTCEIQMVNNLKDRNLAITSTSSNYGNKSSLTDDLGNIYNLSKVTFGGNFVPTYIGNYWNLNTMYQNTPVKLGFVFGGVDRNAKSVPKLVIFFYETGSSNTFGVTFSNYPL